jgi:hypothetical protein
MSEDKAISNGPNARPRDANIGSTSSGLPNDSSKPVEISSDEEARIAESIKRQPSGPDMPYDVTHAEGGAKDGTFPQGEQEMGNKV